MNLDPAIKLIKEFEGCVLKAYRDPVGIPTIGYGTIKNVKMGMVIGQVEAEKLLLDDIVNERLPAVKKCVRVPITNNQLCALISFAYNVGNAALAKSTLVRKLNNGDSTLSVANEFNKWTKAGGRTLKGLVRRRAAERALFLKKEPVEIKTLG